MAKHALLPGYAESSPAVAGGVVYPGTDHTDVGDLRAFNAVTGKRVWDIQDSNGAVDGRVYIGSDNDYEYAFARPGS